MGSTGKLYAAITGDIVDSTKLNPIELDLIKKRLLDAAKTIGGWKTGLVMGTPDFHRGDAWQLLLTHPAFSLRASILIRATLLSLEIRSKANKVRRVDSRLAVGIGAVDKIAAKRISESVGEAFVLSGRSFDKLKTHLNMTVSFSDALNVSSEWMPHVWHLIDALVMKWTLGQAETVFWAAHPNNLTQGEIGQKFTPAKDQQTVSRSLSSAGWHAISEALMKFESLDWDR